MVICVIAVSGGNDDSTTNTPEVTNDTQSVVEITYEQLDLQSIIDELKGNAMKAESIYMDKYVEVIGKITNFDSDGNYISIEPVGVDQWNLDTVTCNIEDDAQRSLLLEKSVGDSVTIKVRLHQ